MKHVRFFCGYGLAPDLSPKESEAVEALLEDMRKPKGVNFKALRPGQEFFFVCRDGRVGNVPYTATKSRESRYVDGYVSRTGTYRPLSSCRFEPRVMPAGEPEV